MSNLKKLEDKYLPDKKKEEPEKEVIERPELHLEPAAIKFAQLSMMTISRSDEEIAASLNIDYARVKKWKKNKYFRAYVDELKIKLVDQEIHETLKVQHLSLLDKEFVEMQRRFEDPFSEENKEIYDGLNDHATKEAFLNRFAYFTPFDKLARTHNETAKSIRMLLPENIEGVQEVKIKETLHIYRNQYEEYRQIRNERERSLKENGIGKGGVSPFAYTKKAQQRVQVEDAKLEEPEATIVSEFTVRRRNEDDEKEED